MGGSLGGQTSYKRRRTGAVACTPKSNAPRTCNSSAPVLWQLGYRRLSAIDDNPGRAVTDMDERASSDRLVY